MFSAGNGYYDEMSGDAQFTIMATARSYDDILVVGAVDRCGKRIGLDLYTETCDPWAPYGSPGSAYGDELDLVAPGSSVYTLDLTGNKGYNKESGQAGDFYDDFGGTSAACPFVAGVAALVYSYYPGITGDEVRERICRTATKLPYYQFTEDKEYGSWNNEVGYGMVNADRALGMADINGNITLTDYNYLVNEITMSAGSILELSENCTLDIKNGSTININELTNYP